MSVHLHGGGIRFVSDQDVGTIAEQSDGGVSVSFQAHDLDGPIDGAQISLQAIADGERMRLAVQATDAALALLKQIALRPARLNGRSAGADMPEPAPAMPRLYYRIVNCVKERELPDPALLEQLGDAMTHVPPQQGVSRAPAAFTYLGQFIAHDMTHMKHNPEDPLEPENYRTHALDLDSLFGAVPGDCEPSGRFRCAGGVCIGETTTGRSEDLPRSAQGAPCVPDSRNDNNLAVSQLAVAIMKFHQVVAGECGTRDPAEQKCITRRHFQSIVLHDYLKAIIHDEVYQDVKARGRSVLFPGAVPAFFQVPAEFAAACFRFGHSQVREEYDWNASNPHATSHTIRRKTYLGSEYVVVPRLKDHWVIDWPRFLPAPKWDAESRFSAAIDIRLAADLLNIDRAWIDDPSAASGGLLVNLAALTLRRGRSLRLPTAQRLREHVAARVPPDAPEAAPIRSDTLFSGRAGSIGSRLSSEARAELEAKTPLWFYILREADFGGDGGRHLGPLGSRIVMETIHAAIEAVPDNILTGRRFSVHPQLAKSGSDEYRFADLIGVVRARASG